MLAIKLDIKPLTVNQAWQGRRFKSADYKQYTSDVLKLLAGVKQATEGKLRVTYRFYLIHHKTTDYDNLIKPLQDILKAGGVIADDRFIYEAVIKKIPSIYDYVEVDIEPMA